MFTRQDALKITGCSSSRLSYLEKVGLVVPKRVGDNFRPVVLLTWEQLLIIRFVKDVRKDLPLSLVKLVADLINETGYQGEPIAVLNGKAFWLEWEWGNFREHVPEWVSGATNLDLTIVELSEYAKELHRWKPLGFDKRVQGTVLEDLKTMEA